MTCNVFVSACLPVCHVCTLYVYISVPRRNVSEAEDAGTWLAHCRCWILCGINPCLNEPLPCVLRVCTDVCVCCVRVDLWAALRMSRF